MQLVEPFATSIGEPVRSRITRWRQEVPLYRDLYRAVSSKSGSDRIEWTALPFITRREMGLNFPRNFLRDGVELEALLDRAEVEVEHTSGTGGERLSLLLGAGWWNEQEGRALKLNRRVAEAIQANPNPRRAVLASPSCGGGLCNQGQTTARERTEDSLLLLSTGRHPWLWNDREWERIVGDILNWSPVFLDADPVYATALARYCLGHGIRLPSLKFILSSYEYASAFHRRTIGRAFGVPAYDLYGSTETGHLLMEDERGHLQASSETALLEVVGLDSHGVGELVVTTMTNEYMPLIRYRIGDLARKFTSKGVTTWELHGRARDVLLDVDGNRLTTRQVDECLAPLEGVLHYQCVQDGTGAVRIRYIAEGSGPTGSALSNATARLQDLLGLSSEIPIRRAEFLLGEPSGKFRLTRRSGS